MFVLWTVIRGEMGVGNGGKRMKVCRNNYEGHMDKTKGRWNQGREVGQETRVRFGHVKFEIPNKHPNRKCLIDSWEINLD